MKLHELQDNQGARKIRKRIGRGIGSGKGKTAGRGHKGQKARTGVRLKGYEGGQMPIYKRLPKRGFRSRASKNFVIVNIGQIQQAFDEGRVENTKLSEWEILHLAGVKASNANLKGGVRLLGKGKASFAVQVELTVRFASQAAREAVEKVGGKITFISKAVDESEEA